MSQKNDKADKADRAAIKIASAINTTRTSITTQINELKEMVMGLLALQNQVNRIETMFIPDIHSSIETLEGLTKWVYCTVLRSTLLRKYPSLDSDVIETIEVGTILIGSQSLSENESGLWMRVRTPRTPLSPYWVLAEDADSGESNLGEYRLTESEAGIGHD